MKKNKQERKKQETKEKCTEATGSDINANKTDEVVELKREVGLWGGISMVMGSMIGASIFVTPSAVIAAAKSPALALLVWGLGGVSSILGALVYIELGTVVPKSGGDYSYLLEAYGEFPAFMVSFLSTVVLAPAVFAFFSLNIAKYIIRGFVPLDLEVPETAAKLAAIVAIGFMTYVNCRSVKLAIRLHILFTATKVIALVTIIGFGLYNISQGRTDNLAKGFEGSTESPGDIASSFYGVLLAYGGWQILNNITEEIRNPYKTLPFCILIGVTIVTVLYVLVNVSYLTVLSPEQFGKSSAVAVDFSRDSMGSFSIIMPVVIAISIFGAAIGSQFSEGRLCYVASRQGHLPEVLSYIHINNLTPAPAVTLRALLAVPMVLYGDVLTLINFLFFSTEILGVAATSTVIALRFTNEDAPRPYKVPMVIPVIVLILKSFLVIAPLIGQPRLEYLLALCAFLIGVIVYIAFVKYKKISFSLGPLTKSIQLIFQVAPVDYGIKKIKSST